MNAVQIEKLDNFFLYISKKSVHFKSNNFGFCTLDTTHCVVSKVQKPKLFDLKCTDVFEIYLKKLSELKISMAAVACYLVK